MAAITERGGGKRRGAGVFWVAPVEAMIFRRRSRSRKRKNPARGPIVACSLALLAAPARADIDWTEQSTLLDHYADNFSVGDVDGDTKITDNDYLIGMMEFIGGISNTSDCTEIKDWTAESFEAQFGDNDGSGQVTLIDYNNSVANENTIDILTIIAYDTDLDGDVDSDDSDYVYSKVLYLQTRDEDDDAADVHFGGDCQPDDPLIPDINPAWLYHGGSPQCNNPPLTTGKMVISQDFGAIPHNFEYIKVPENVADPRVPDECDHEETVDALYIGHRDEEEIAAVKIVNGHCAQFIEGYDITLNPPKYILIRYSCNLAVITALRYRGRPFDCVYVVDKCTAWGSILYPNRLPCTGDPPVLKAIFNPLTNGGNPCDDN